MEPGPGPVESIIGEEAHIVAQSPRGPRWRALPDGALHEYDNLILLCRNHHKLVDDQPETFTEPILRRLKANHERWVATTLTASTDEAVVGRPRVRVHLLASGEEVLDIVAGAHASDYNHDPLEDESEVALVGGFLQSAHDWGELWNEIEPGQHVEARFHLGRQLQELRSYGFLVYGSQDIRRVRVGNSFIDNWKVAVLRVLRDTNPHVPKIHRVPADGGGRTA